MSIYISLLLTKIVNVSWNQNQDWISLGFYFDALRTEKMVHCMDKLEESFFVGWGLFVK